MGKNIFSDVKQTNIHEATMCHKCPFMKIGCVGRQGLLPEVERINCIPAFTALSDFEVEHWGDPKYEKKQRKPARKRGRSRKNQKKK